MSSDSNGGITLHCAYCDRPIHGWTGLDELRNMIAHLAEHHDLSVNMRKALDLREAWEAAGYRRADGR